MIEASRPRTIHEEPDMRSNPTLLVDDPMSHARITIVEERKQLRQRLTGSIDLFLTAGVREKGAGDYNAHYASTAAVTE